MATTSVSMVSISVLLVVIATFLSTTVSKRSLPSNQCALRPLQCKSNGRHINVKIIARNILVQPTFEQETIIKKPQSSLIHFLEQASEQNGAFNFSASYHRSLGYMINTINHVTANVNAKTYWNIKSVTNGNTSVLCGVSTYIPKSGEEILFNFTTYGFSATYYPTLGYFIDTINGVTGFKENKTFWHIIGVNGVGSLECGASSFIPKYNDTILFNFTTWSQAGFDY